MPHKNTNPKLVVHPGVDWILAQKVAKRFHNDYPDRVGVRECCGYGFEGYDQELLVYRTKGGAIVVRK